MTATPEALLYDFGGVVIEIDFDRVFARWAELGGVPFDQVKARFRHGEEYQAHERGTLGMEAFFDAVRRDVGIDIGDDAMLEGWNRVFGAEIPGTVAAIRRLGPRIPQYLFSNTNQEHHDVWGPRHAKALAPLRGTFLSYRIGHRKPEREAFEHVSASIGVEPAKILFFDDTLHNIEGARVAGLQAVLVRSPEDVANAVRRWM